ncbi:MAG: GAF domain-containing protein [Anaerolineales bacterium]|nr:GAF domain-containing protein [Anaerolineales bacterium]
MTPIDHSDPAGAAPRLRVLVIEDQPDDAELVVRELRRAGYTLDWQRVDTPEAFEAALDPALDIILSDFALPRFNGMEALRRLQARGLDIPFILISGTIGEDLAVETMRLGATDYLIKDRLSRLASAVQAAIEGRRLRRQAAEAEQALRRNAARFQALIENGAEAIWLVDQRAGITYVSPATRRVLGYAPEEVLGRDSLSLVHPDDLPAVRVVFENLVVGQLPRALMQARLRTQRGDWGWTEVSFDNQLRDPLVNALVVHLRDVTERVQRERELEAIARLNRAMREAPNRAAVLPLILEQVAALLHPEGASINLYNGATGETLIGAALGDWAPLHGTTVAQTGSLALEVMTTGRPFVSSDVRRDARRDPHYLPQTLTPHTTALAGVPLRAREVIIGSLWVGRRVPLEPEEVQLLGALADISAGAIQRMTLHEQTEVQLQRLSTLRTIDLAISASLDLNVTLNVLISQAIQQLSVDAAAILLFDPHTQQLTYAAGHGLRTTTLDRLRLRLGEGLAGQIAAERQMRVVADLAALPPATLKADLAYDEGFVVYIGAPLIAKGRLQGVFEVLHRAPLRPAADWLEFVETLAGQAAIAIDNATVYADLQRSHNDLRLAYDSTLEGWSRALDLRDRETEGHTRRVADLSLQLGRVMGLRSEDLLQLRRGALLHDIGKLGVPDYILHKPGPLTDEEWRIMRRHPVHAYEMLAPIAYLQRALDVPHYHHEKWDGTGYPDGLSGLAIPLAARIFAVADVYDALRSDRPYRPGWSEAQARAYIAEQAGRHFDPAVVAAFQQVEGAALFK